MIVIAVLLAFGAAGCTVVYYWRVQETDRRVLKACEQIIDRHVGALARERARLVEYDPYGKALVHRWVKEIGYFVNTQIEPVLKPKQLQSLQKQWTIVATRIEDRAAETEATHPAFKALPADATGEDYELFCASQLRQSGWDTQLTKASGDQGVDVIATKGSIRLVLQCKLYRQPVGNNAVQQVSAGKLHERAHHAAVVTNSSYTRAAKQLARTNGVHLLHHSQLCDVDELLGITKAEEA